MGNDFWMVVVHWINQYADADAGPVIPKAMPMSVAPPTTDTLKSKKDGYGL